MDKGALIAHKRHPMNSLDFPLSSEDCRLLLLLETSGSIKDTASALQRDISVVSRQISRLAELVPQSPVVEKVNGRWQVSEAGRRVNAWTRDAILGQQRALQSQVSLRIGATREFAARVLGPGLKELLADQPGVQVTVISSDQGVESLLLSGDVDLAFDCGRPRDPSVRFRLGATEPFAVVAAPGALGSKAPRSLEDLLARPHLAYRRLSSARILQTGRELPHLFATFSDLATLRAAAVAGLGWAVVPRYAVAVELARGELKEIRADFLPVIEPENFGVWWLRERKGVEPWIRQALAWLKEREL